MGRSVVKVGGRRYVGAKLTIFELYNTGCCNFKLSHAVRQKKHNITRTGQIVLWVKGEKNEKWNKRDDMMILTKRGLTENIDGERTF